MMKHTVILTIGFMILSTQAFALDLLGPPMAGTKKDQWSIGLEYVHGESDIDAGSVSLFPYFPIVFPGAKIKDVEMNKIYCKFSGNPTENSELFLRMGGAKAEVDKSSNINNWGYLFGESNYNFTIGGGTKITMLKSDNIQLGLIAQLSYVDITNFDEFRGTIYGIPISLSNEAEVLEAQFAIGPTVKLFDNASIYGGAMLHFLDGEAKATEELTSISVTSDLEQDSIFGGFMGLGLQIAENNNLNIEYQVTGDSHAIGVGVVFKFGGPTKPEKRTFTRQQTPKLSTQPKVDAPSRKIRGYRVKKDASGEFAKDEDGNFIFIPVYEDEQKK